MHWAHWWKRPLGPAVLENVSWISPARLWDVAVAQGIPGGGRLRRVCDVLEFGADIGCVGRGRLPTRSANGDSLWQPEIGVVVADVLQDWVVKGVAAGPLTRREVEMVVGRQVWSDTCHSDTVPHSQIILGKILNPPITCSSFISWN